MAKKNGEQPPIEPMEEMTSGDDEQASDALETVEEVAAAPGAAETPVLSADEMKKIEEQARREVEQEFKKKLRAKALDAEKKKVREQLSMAENGHLNGVLSDLVRIQIRIPEFSNTPWITNDEPDGQKIYLDGSTYVVKRHIANSLRETMQRMRWHQNEIDGKKRNRQLPDGSFVDAFTGHVSRGRTIGAEAA